MFMIIWGKQTQCEVAGRVADFCPACGRIQEFLVAKINEGDHVYFVQIGGLRHVGYLKQCVQCGWHDGCNAANYSALLPTNAKRLSIEALLEKTNADLLERLHAEAHSELIDAQAPDANDTGSLLPPLEALKKRVDELDYKNPEVIKLRAKLEYWSELDENRKRQLHQLALKPPDGRSRVQRAKEFVFAMAATYSLRPNYYIAWAVGGLILAAAGIAFAFVGQESRGGVLCCGIMGAPVIAVITYVLVKNERHELWTINVFLPRAKESGISLESIAEANTVYNWWDPDEKKRVAHIELKAINDRIRRELNSPAPR